MFDAVEHFISSSIWGAPRGMQGETIMASVDGAGTILGAVIFQNYDPENGVIEMSAAAASPRWLTRPVLFDMFTYAFDQLKCQAVAMRCEADNNRLARIFGAYGFQRYDVPRLRGRDRPESIYVLGDDVWRKNGYHKEHAHG